MNNEKRKTNAKFTATGFGAAYFSVGIISILFLSVIFSFTVQAIAGSSSAAQQTVDSDWYKFAAYLVTPVAIILSGTIFCKAFGEKIPEVARMKKTETKHYLSALLLAAGMFFGLSSLNGFFIEFLVKYAGYNYTETALPGFSPLNVVLTVITVCLIPAATEEFFFRGILIYSLSGAGRVIAALISGLYFSLFHMNPAQTPYQFVVGFLFGLLALDSGSVFPSVLAHFLNNLVIVILYYAVPSFGGFTGISLVIATIFGLICIAAFLFLTLKGKAKEGKSEYKFDYKTFFLYSAIGVFACLMMWVAGLIA